MINIFLPFYYTTDYGIFQEPTKHFMNIFISESNFLYVYRPRDMVLFVLLHYVTGLISILPLVLLAAYVLIIEKDAWLKRTAVKAAAVVQNNGNKGTYRQNSPKVI